MAKKTRSEEPSDPNRFRVSKTKVGKQELVTVTFQLTELQETHLDMVVTAEETTRAEFCKQCVSFCLANLGKPFPEAGDITDEMREALLERREKRQAWAESRNIGKKNREEE